MARSDYQKLRVYRLSEQLADRVWNVVTQWDRLAQNTLGKQMIRAADSIGANISEGVGRGSYVDNRRFVKIARGSLLELQHWLRRAYCRELLSSREIDELKPMLDELAPKLNAYLRSIGPVRDGQRQ